MFSFGPFERCCDPFADGEPTGITTKGTTKQNVIARLVAEGLAYDTGQECAHGTRRYKASVIPKLTAGSAAHRSFAKTLGRAYYGTAT